MCPNIIRNSNRKEDILYKFLKYIYILMRWEKDMINVFGAIEFLLKVSKEIERKDINSLKIYIRGCVKKIYA